MKPKTRLVLASLFAVVFLSACGGGGGGGDGAPATYTVGGAVTGLVGSNLSLLLNGSSALNLNSDGNFTFGTAIATGANYTVAVATQPSNPSQLCSIANASGTVGNSNITNVAVTCEDPSYSIGGTVSGLLGTGLTLRLNGGTALPISQSGTFTFGTTLRTGETYAVTLESQPAAPSQACTIDGASGTVPAANVTSIAVSCPAPPPVAGDIEQCKLVNPNVQSLLGLGFPRNAARLKSTGTVRIPVLFVDFADAVANETPEQTFARVSPTSENYFEIVSYGAMKVIYEPHFRWLRMSQPSNGYGFGSITFQQHRAYMQEAIDLAGAEVDYSGADALLVLATPNASALVNGPAFTATPGFGLDAGGHVILNGATSGFDLRIWGGYWANHELGHALGLPDLYMQAPPYNFAVGMFSLMGNIAGPARELMAFERWTVGWLNDDQVACATTAGEWAATLSPVERVGGTKMVVAPLSNTLAVVAESRRPEGLDGGFAPGVLVYLVDSSQTNQQGVVRVLPVANDDIVKSSAIRRLGDSATIFGVTIRVIATAEDGDTVLVTR